MACIIMPDLAVTTDPTKKQESKPTKEDQEFVADLRAAILGTHSIARDQIADVFREYGIHSFSFAEYFCKDIIEIESRKLPDDFEVYFPFLEADADRLQFRIHVHREFDPDDNKENFLEKTVETPVSALRTFISPKTDRYLAEVRKKVASRHQINKDHPLKSRECIEAFLHTSANGNRTIPGHLAPIDNHIDGAYGGSLEQCLSHFPVNNHRFKISGVFLPIELTKLYPNESIPKYYLHDMKVGLMSYEILYHPLFYDHETNVDATTFPDNEKNDPILLRVAISSPKCLYGVLTVMFKPPSGGNGIDFELKPDELEKLCAKLVKTLDLLVTDRYLPSTILLHASKAEKRVKTLFDRDCFYDKAVLQKLNSILEPSGIGRSRKLTTEELNDYLLLPSSLVASSNEIQKRLMAQKQKNGQPTKIAASLIELSEIVKLGRAQIHVSVEDREEDLLEKIVNLYNGALSCLQDLVRSPSWTFTDELRAAAKVLNDLKADIHQQSLEYQTKQKTVVEKVVDTFRGRNPFHTDATISPVQMGIARKNFLLNSVAIELGKQYGEWKGSKDDFERGFHVMNEQRIQFITAQAERLEVSKDPMTLFNSTRVAVIRSLIFHKYRIASPAMIDQTRKLIRGARTMEVRPEPGRSLPSGLIYGEAGSGKDDMARMVVCFSPDFAKLLECEVKTINMAAVKPSENIIPHLFGTRNECGAVTPTKIAGLEQDSSAAGAFILDELNSMEYDMQGVLLRWLENGETLARGSEPVKYVRGIVIGVVNEDPDVVTYENEIVQLRRSADFLGRAEVANMYSKLTESRHLRPDLVYRLKRGVYVALPSLAERREDIPLLFSAFLQSSFKDLFSGTGEDPRTLEIEYRAFERMQDRIIDWPGNMRQLQAVSSQIAMHLFDVWPQREKLHDEEQVNVAADKKEEFVLLCKETDVRLVLDRMKLLRSN